VISYAVWLYFRFPLSLHMVEEMLAASGILRELRDAARVGKKFGKAFSVWIRKRAPGRGGKWHLDEVVVSIAGKQHWLARRRSEWIRSRRPGPAPQGYSRGAEAHDKAPEIGGRADTRHDHGQAQVLRRRESEDPLSRRTPPAQGSEQSV
jgi:putative transposase